MTPEDIIEETNIKKYTRKNITNYKLTRSILFLLYIWFLVRKYSVYPHFTVSLRILYLNLGFHYWVIKFRKFF